MIVYDLYYKVNIGGLERIQVETYQSEHDLIRDFHNRVIHLDNYVKCMGYEQRNIELKEVPEHKPRYSILSNFR